MSMPHRESDNESFDQLSKGMRRNKVPGVEESILHAQAAQAQRQARQEAASAIGQSSTRSEISTADWSQINGCCVGCNLLWARRYVFRSAGVANILAHYRTGRSLPGWLPYLGLFLRLHRRTCDL